MITPAYMSTATERVLPRLYLDFTTGTLDPRVTVARALNTATRVNSSGLIEIIDANLPRFDYDPVTLFPRGLLVEESRTNLLLRSSEFDNAGAWSTSRVTIDPDSAVAPDGTQTADTFVSAGGSFPQLFQFITLPAGDATFSIYVKSDGTSQIAQTLLLDGASASFTPTSNWTRVFVTKTGSAGGSVPAIIVTNSPSAPTSSFFMWGAQVEAGPYASSYIPTTTTSLLRNADNVSMTGTNFSSWYNQDEGTFVAWFDYSSGTSASKADGRILMEASDGTASNRHIIYNRSGTAQSGLTQVGGATQAVPFTAGTLSANVASKVAYAYKKDNFGFSLNGAATSSASPGNIPTVSQLSIGSSGGFNGVTGHVARFLYYPQRLTNAEVQAFSK